VKPPDHNRLIAAAAKSVLVSVGCAQKGRSRTWLDDHHWWVGVIEFQPSSWSKGSYLNVGACWLWYEKDYLSFDDGSRVEAFHQFKSIEQFADSAQLLAERAREEVLALRERFPTIQSAAAYLRDKRTKDIWGHYHAGVSAGLVGDTRTARMRLAAVIASKLDFPWALELKKRTAELAALVDDTARFRCEITAVVGRRRSLLKLPSLQDGASLEP